MKTEHQYTWLTLWNGKMKPTRYKCTEEFIKQSHPEAVRVEGTLRVVEVPETEDEWRVRRLQTDTAHIARSPLPHNFGTQKEKGP